MAGDIAWLDVWRKKGLVAGERSVNLAGVVPEAEASCRLDGETITVEPGSYAFHFPDRTLVKSEKEFQKQVIAFAESRRWKCFHQYDSRRSKAGWPDLVLVREKILYRELKVKGGKLSDEQRDTLECLRLAGADAEVWMPADWSAIEELLT